MVHCVSSIDPYVVKSVLSLDRSNCPKIDYLPDTLVLGLTTTYVHNPCGVWSKGIIP
ncbi:Protein of unknown function [Pyronema omphalodes CBS 100304]|uniref:Uncharacterized protein n=1 Tax=Pyronema omphalodes (strain CBS 100304) TaxID=1076935 RepID=U4KWI2_PYROM|nr:Protein of unknown function [Pyronema omphalodes CBS 100304]